MWTCLSCFFQTSPFSIIWRRNILIQVAKSNGNSQAAKQVAYLWAKSLGGDSAVKLLTKFGLLEMAIDYATENWWLRFYFILPFWLLNVRSLSENNDSVERETKIILQLIDSKTPKYLASIAQRWWCKGINSARPRVSLLVWPNMYGIHTSAIVWWIFY